MEEIKLTYVTLKYKPVSPFRMNAVALAERDRYIKEEWGGIEPEPPSYTVQYGGGQLPNGTPLETWTDEQEYTIEDIKALRVERDRLIDQVRPGEQYRTALASIYFDELPPKAAARLREVGAVLRRWEKYVKKMNALAAAMNDKKYRAALWHSYSENLPEDNDWIAELAEDGIDTDSVPRDEREKLVYWLEKIAVATQDEFDELLYTAVQNEQKLAEVRAGRAVVRRMFQRALGEQ